MTEANQTLLDRILTDAKLTNHDVVVASEGKLNHKNVQKARTGSRPVTDRVARSLTDTVNALMQPEDPWTPRKLFPGYPRGKAVVASDNATSDSEEDES